MAVTVVISLVFVLRWILITIGITLVLSGTHALMRESRARVEYSAVPGSKAHASPAVANKV